MLKFLRRLFEPDLNDAKFDEKLSGLRRKTPTPVIWLVGKTQSGKSSIIKFLTGAEDVEIGRGFRATTKHSREYLFPTDQAPIVRFIDTRGIGEAGYDPTEDAEKYSQLAHVVIATARLMDHAQEPTLNTLNQLRSAQPQRTMLLALTCLHEGYPQQQHPDVYPYGPDGSLEQVPPGVRPSLEEQTARFGKLVDSIIPVDITSPDEGYQPTDFGGFQLKQQLLEALPLAYRQVLLCMDEITGELRQLHEQRAIPFILGYSSLAATAGAIPVPLLDVVLLPGIQTRMVYHLAQLYGQPLSASRFLELSTSVGLGLLVRQTVRSLAKVIPGAGSIIGSVLAGSSTYALGRAFCFYYSGVLSGHVPKAEDLRQYYDEELKRARQYWTNPAGNPTPRSQVGDE